MASGFNVVDFMDLPPVERSILRLILRETSMTYPQIAEAVAALPAERQIDPSKVDSALAQLLRSQWVVCKVSNQQTFYRVNAVQKTTQDHGLWGNLGLDALDNCEPFQPALETAELIPSLKRGKRLLPTQIWDSLTDSTPSEREPEAPARRPARLAGLLDKLTDDDGSKDR